MALKSTGAKLAIDDFGTGYSSPQRVARFPVDVLKIEPRLCARNDGQRQRRIHRARHHRTTAHSLRLKVVAEGVETTAQCDALESWAAT
ncbi:MAG: EAL domain-containing protein [Burkholderiales bacterium]|nr:EAL domain-containing protein [Burkholderiales bacterium]